MDMPAAPPAPLDTFDRPPSTSSADATEETRLRNPLLEGGYYGGEEEELFQGEKVGGAGGGVVVVE